MSLSNEMLVAGDAVKVALSELAKMAQPNCKKCFGRGYIGKDTITGKYLVCSKCLRRDRREKAKQG